MKTQLILNIVQEAQQHKIQLFAKGGRLGMKKKKTDTNSCCTFETNQGE